MTFACRTFRGDGPSGPSTTGWKFPTVTGQKSSGSAWTNADHVRSNDAMYATTSVPDNNTSQVLTGRSFAFGLLSHAVIDSIDWEIAIAGGAQLTRYIVDVLNPRTSYRLLDLSNVTATRQVVTRLDTDINLFTVAELMADTFEMSLYIDNEDGESLPSNCQVDYFAIRVNYHLP